jgi:transcriptional regulator with XRE-family HTH domain
MSQEEIFINGELLRLSREARGWVINDMATRACMSVKQIRQLEEGGMSAFYSAAVKATSAKKVGSLLGLSADQVFSQTEAVLEIEDAIAPEALIEKTDAESDKSVSAEPEVAKPEYPAEPLIKALAQVPAATPAEPEVVQPATDETPSSKNSLWMIAVLLAVALALGAYFQPQEEPVAAEPVPPIQVLPTDAVDPASAASAADSAASSAEVALIQASAPAAMTLQKPASTGSAIVSPAVSPVASVARVVAPVASATATAAAPRVSSPAAVSTPTASAAVKAP